jgi:hypothetical protein
LESVKKPDDLRIYDMFPLRNSCAFREVNVTGLGMVISSMFVAASQSNCLFLSSRERIFLVENRQCFTTTFEPEEVRGDESVEKTSARIDTVEDINLARRIWHFPSFSKQPDENLPFLLIL